MAIWDFIGKDTNELTHGLHLYPAKLNPHIVRRLIKQYGPTAKNLLDPFCGSGTTLIEARLAGLNAIGSDINPTARFISQVKCQNYDVRALESFVENLSQELDSMKFIGLKTAITRSGFRNEQIRTWYPNKSIREIASIMELINSMNVAKESNENLILFAKVTLSDCLREVSIQRMGEWKNYRKENWRVTNLDKFYQPLIPLFRKKMRKNFLSVQQYAEALKEIETFDTTNFHIDGTNCVINTDYSFMPESGFDLIITSPPYGDSPTTVAYEQFSWMTNVWLGLDPRPPGQLAKDMMGGKIAGVVEKTGCKIIDSAFSKMEDKFARSNYAFYRDYLKSIENISKVVNKDGHVCYIVGNRTSGGQNLRMDLFTRWAFEQNGFKRVGKIKRRRVPNTRMPAMIAINGKNIEKIKVRTMNHEYIIVCQKTAS